LYNEAVELNKEGKSLEAKSMMQMIAQQFPDTPAGKQASKDLYLIDVILKQDLQQRQKDLTEVMRRVANALTRYKGNEKEYPAALTALVPDYLEKVPETPWGHPFLYRAYVKVPIMEVKGKRGAAAQKFNTLYDGYQLACLGVDAQPGGEGMATDVFIVDGEFCRQESLPEIPQPQPAK
ncbi:MAG TPA: hypothetical protein VN436_16970, partial [Holophaga sp.]|nr:hypothetical protein [Holophaga sp.]